VPRPLPADLPPSAATKWVCNLAKPKRTYVPKSNVAYEDLRGLVNVGKTIAVDIVKGTTNGLENSCNSDILGRSRSATGIPTTDAQTVDGRPPPPPPVATTGTRSRLSVAAAQCAETQPPITPITYLASTSGWAKTRDENAAKLKKNHQN
jgi:hypothetical protein